MNFVAVVLRQNGNITYVDEWDFNSSTWEKALERTNKKIEKKYKGSKLIMLKIGVTYA